MAENQEVEISKAEIANLPLGIFSTKWSRKTAGNMLGGECSFSATFDAKNETVKFEYVRGDELDHLQLTFKVQKVLKLDIKYSVYLNEGEGTWFHRGKTQDLSKQEMICFVTGPQMVFGIDVPHIISHEAFIRDRVLRKTFEPTRHWKEE
mmetsp:Transcript_24110/g.37567  ORF Transcript_24110/g.37567 Transcript_24110/m.37567 type:complete len:150 (-) Transcript_24110:53-502(-)|eukprot:CAMPEP_0201523164 /NCGR_PEP_ID=MMETSP0161_2-20130828/18825_1 /ASSEMBLY_ACC=CAM_ASM_000251 /TAXON_ID=180227 /ORGANISM="Neoparamoeba aestuarina, Strain SoJaBio B1-5/56/2" /LENGTH=149 /DNA_ID=CAMNT_0047922181 /DNA_START=74 /DNA_END=523 /DNA_ORIENTATION=+